MDNFKSFYHAPTNNIFDYNKNLNIIYKNVDGTHNNLNKKIFDISKFFELPPP